MLNVEERLLENDPDVLALFAGNPFSQAAPQRVARCDLAILVTDRATKRKGRRMVAPELLGMYAPPLERTPAGQIVISR